MLCVGDQRSGVSLSLTLSVPAGPSPSDSCPEDATGLRPQRFHECRDPLQVRAPHPGSAPHPPKGSPLIGCCPNRWLRLCVRSRWEEAVPLALKMATEQGRMKFTRPLFRCSTPPTSPGGRPPFPLLLWFDFEVSPLYPQGGFPLRQVPQQGSVGVSWAAGGNASRHLGTGGQRPAG